MKRRISLLFISIVMLNGMLLSCGYGPAYADEGVAGDTMGGGSNEAGEGEFGQARIKELENSGDGKNYEAEDEVSGNAVHADKLVLDCKIGTVRYGKAEMHVTAEAYGNEITLIQVENTAVGIRKDLYHADVSDEGQTTEDGKVEGDKTEDGKMEGDSTEQDKVELDFTITANGRYKLYVIDSDGEEESLELGVSEIPVPSMSSYVAEAEYNLSHHEEPEFKIDGWGGMNDEYGTVAFGGDNSREVPSEPTNAQRYTVKTRGGGKMDEEALKKYGDWSMLRIKERPDDFKAWFEPYAADGSLLNQPLENLVDLSDYKVDLFSVDVGLNSAEVLGEKASPKDSGGVVIEGLKKKEDKSKMSSGKEGARIIGMLALGVVGITTVTSMVIRKHGFGFVRRRLRLGLK